MTQIEGTSNLEMLAHMSASTDLDTVVSGTCPVCRYRGSIVILGKLLYSAGAHLGKNVYLEH